MNVYFTIFEALVLILFGICLRHAMRKGVQTVLRLLAGVAFGVLLEWATIQQLDAYSYGKFLIMIDAVPIVIGVSWGVILYSVMLFSNSTQLPWHLRPILDALLALNIDLAMDAIAIRLGMWDWGGGLAYEYFGVPVENFWAWFWVIFSFSMFFRLFNRIQSGIKVWLAPLMAIVLGVVGVLVTNRVITELIPRELDWVSTALVVLVAAGILFTQRNKLCQRDTTHPLTFWVPLGFHLFFTLIGIISQVIFQPTFLLIVSILMLAISLLVHWDIVRKVIS